MLTHEYQPDNLSQSESLDNQTTHYRKFIESNPDYDYVGVFADHGRAGTKDNDWKIK